MFTPTGYLHGALVQNGAAVLIYWVVAVSHRVNAVLRKVGLPIELDVSPGVQGGPTNGAALIVETIAEHHPIR